MASRRNVVLAGTGFKNNNGSDRAQFIRRFCKRGVSVDLVREPDNPHDANAVAVYIRPRLLFFIRPKLQIGYVPATAAKRIAKVLNSGETIESSIANVWAPVGLNHPEVSIKVDY